MTSPIPVAGLTLQQLAGYLETEGIDRKYAPLIAYWVYRKRVAGIDEMTSISSGVRKTIASKFTTGIIAPAARFQSADGSVKYLFSYHGNRRVESVFIPEKKRNTVCVSSQCGCARACRYCRTGELSFRGNLTAGEIVNQVLAIPEAAAVTHVVFMGMGEPLDNAGEVIRAIEILTAEWGLSIGHSKVTVSTVGILPAVADFLRATRSNLTLSLVSPLPHEREKLVPAERLYPASRVIDVIREAPKVRKRRFSAAYLMLQGVNDTGRHLEALKRLIGDSEIRVNLLRYHPFGDAGFKPSDDETMNSFRESLAAAGIDVSIRKSRGEDIGAACGLLG